MRVGIERETRTDLQSNTGAADLQSNRPVSDLHPKSATHPKATASSSIPRDRTAERASAAL